MSTQIPHHAEPEQTELAHWFTDFQRKIAPHTNKIVLAVILATIGVVAYQVMARSEAAKVSDAWSRYFACQSADDFQNVAEDHVGSPVEGWARLQAARSFVAQGVQASMTNRKLSDENLENGKAQLEKLLNSATTPDEVRELALSQMAVCLETLCDGDVKPATDAYQKLLDKYPETAVAPWARHRLEELKKPATGEFYAWFRKSKPAPPERPQPRDVKPGELPNVELGPGTDDPLPPGTPGTPPAAPATEAPAAETKPAESPAAETPATPATEKPTEPAATPAAPGAETPAAPATPPAAEAPAKPADAPAETPKP